MKFKVGDRVRYRMCAGNDQGIQDGEIGVILGVGEPGCAGDPTSLIDFGRKTATLMDCVLELVPPDREQTVSWSQCDWRPSGVSA